MLIKILLGAICNKEVTITMLKILLEVGKKRKNYKTIIFHNTDKRKKSAISTNKLTTGIYTNLKKVTYTKCFNIG